MYIRKILFGIVFILLCANICYSQSGWVWQNPVPTGQTLYACNFINLQSGWVGGDNGTLLKTTNSGLNWNNVLIPDSLNVRKIYFLNSETGWISTNNLRTLFKTTNGGLNWSPQYMFTNFLYDFSFVDSQTGFIGSGNGTVLKTTNGGSNWDILNSGVASSPIKITFFNSLTGFFAGIQNSLSKTTNGGLNWFSVYSHTNSWNSAFFINENTGFYSLPGEIYKTTDGGGSWNLKHTSSSYVYNINFLTSSIGFASTFDGKIFKTTNGGESWVTQSAAQGYSLYSISILNEETAFVPGFKGTILKTSNGGTNWENCRTSFTNFSLNNVSFLNDLTGFVIGDSARVFKSVNSGINWTQINTGLFQGKNLKSVYFINSTTGFIGGENGIFAKTTNTGSNWNVSFFNGNFRRIDFIDSARGWISTNLGLYRTTNSGISWSELSTGAEQIYGMDLINASTGFVTSLRNIYFTTNGGTNWYTKFNEPNSYNFSPIFFINEQTGWAAGQNTFLKTINGGISWSQYNHNFGFVSLQFLDINNGYSVSNEGNLEYNVLKTTNGGVNWTKICSTNSNFFTYSLNAVNFINVNTGWIVGSTGLVLKTTTGGNVFISQISTEIPEKYSLQQNYPNPFNPTTNIKFDIHKQGIATLKVFDLLGKEMETLVDEQLSVGTYEVTFNASSLPSGIYFYVLKTGDFVESKKMILVK